MATLLHPVGGASLVANADLNQRKRWQPSQRVACRVGLRLSPLILAYRLHTTLNKSRDEFGLLAGNAEFLYFT